MTRKAGKTNSVPVPIVFLHAHRGCAFVFSRYAFSWGPYVSFCLCLFPDGMCVGTMFSQLLFVICCLIHSCHSVCAICVFIVSMYVFEAFHGCFICMVSLAHQYASLTCYILHL